MKKVRIREILDFLKEKGDYPFVFTGSLEGTIEGFSSLINYKDKTMTWIKSNQAVYDKRRRIALCIVQEGVSFEAEAMIVTPASKAVFFALLEEFYGNQEDGSRIGIGTYIGERVRLGENVRIGNNCSISGEISIGDRTRIANNVVISNRVTIGSGCEIQSLTVIGEDGYGYSEDENHKKTMIRHYGGVQIGNDVFIGSHVNIARGTIDDTVIGDGVKIAPTTHIGHNNRIGRDASVICSQLFGSVNIGENAYVTSSVVRNQCKIGNNAVVGLGSVVTKDVENGITVIGVPAKKMEKR